jgi:hypothetical protein
VELHADVFYSELVHAGEAYGRPFVKSQHPGKMHGLQGEALAHRPKTMRFSGAVKARSASDRPHEQAA